MNKPSPMVRNDRSMRWRIAVITAVTVGLALSVGGFGVYVYLRAGVIEDFHSQLRIQLVATASSAELGEGGLNWSHAPKGVGPSGLCVSFVDDQGKLLGGVPWLVPPVEVGSLESPRIVDVDIPEEGHGEAAWARHHMESEREEAGENKDNETNSIMHAFRPALKNAGNQVTIGVALPWSVIEQRMARLRIALIIGSLLTIAVTVGVLALALDRVLSPLARLAQELAAFDWRRFGKRLDVNGRPGELAPVVAHFNELLERLERAYDLAKSFNAAAAHELRTPIAGLRATIEVAQHAGHGHAEALATSRAIVMQMQARLDNLLMAARLDAGQVQPMREEVDVDTLLRDAWRAHADEAAKRELRPSWHVQSSSFANADDGAVRMIITNLISNAVEHADSGGEIGLSTHVSEGWLTIAIENACSKLTLADVQQVFERQWRGSGQRDGASRHAGLGMFIARELAGLMGGSIAAEFIDGRIRISVRLPAAAIEAHSR